MFLLMSYFSTLDIKLNYQGLMIKKDVCIWFWFGWILFDYWKFSLCYNMWISKYTIFCYHFPFLIFELKFHKMNVTSIVVVNCNTLATYLTSLMPKISMFSICISYIRLAVFLSWHISHITSTYLYNLTKFQRHTLFLTGILLDDNLGSLVVWSR